MNDQKCIVDKIGMCLGIRVKLTSKKWRYRGGGRSFGWVSTRVTKLLCKAKNDTHVGPKISADNVLTDGERFGDIEGDGTRDNYQMC